MDAFKNYGCEESSWGLLKRALVNSVGGFGKYNRSLFEIFMSFSLENFGSKTLQNFPLVQ